MSVSRLNFKKWAEENGKAIANEVKDFFLNFLWQTSAITSLTAIDSGAEVVRVPFQGHPWKNFGIIWANVGSFRFDDLPGVEHVRAL